MDWNVLYQETTGSTNDDAFQGGLRGEPDGTVYIAGQQTAGRGRMNRGWFSPAGFGLYISALVRPRIIPETAGLLSFCSANAMRAALAAQGAEGVGIKWPNDILLMGRKICGILSVCRTVGPRLDFAVIGAGVNLRRGAYPQELRDRAVSLEEGGIEPDRKKLMEDYLMALRREVTDLEIRGAASVLERTCRYCVTLKREVMISGAESFRGTAEGIGPAGELLVRTADGNIRPVFAGDVSVRGVMGYAE